MKTITLSVVLATRNEEANIGRCLEAVKAIADEIIVADEQSTDQTVAIAKKFGARVLSEPHHTNFHITKNKAIRAARGRWILQLDADEVVSPELAEEIRAIVHPRGHPRGVPRVRPHLGGETHPGSEINGYWINRKNWFLDRFLTKGGQYPDPTLRLYRRGLGHLPAADVHEQAKVSGAVGHLQHDLLHYRDTSFAKYLDGFNRYSSLVADQLQSRGVSFNLLNTLNYLFLKPAVTFFTIYFRHLGLVDGFPGFIFALFSGLIHPVAYIKYWQHKYYPEND